MTAMTTTAHHEYVRAGRALSRVVDAVPAGAWAAPSPCEGWSAADVLRHIIDTQREFFTGHGFDVPPADGQDVAASWHTHSAAVAALLADPQVAGHGFDGFFGPTTVGEAVLSFYCFDLLVHRWDIARATGGDETLTDDELTALEHTIAAAGEALQSDGVCEPPIDIGPDASRQDAVLAALGRDPRPPKR